MRGCHGRSLAHYFLAMYLKCFGLYGVGPVVSVGWMFERARAHGA